MKRYAWQLSPRQSLRLLLLRYIGMIARRMQQHPPPHPRRVLVIKPDHLGDVVLLTPALRMLRQQLPAAHITLLVGPWSQPVVAHDAHVDIVLTCPFPGFTRTAKASLLQPYWLLFKMALLLRAGHFDTAIIARDDHWWGALLAVLAGIPRRIGHATPKVAPLLTTALPHHATDHVTEQSISLIEALTGRRGGQPLALHPPMSTTDRAWAEAWLAEQGVDGMPLVAIHPGAGGAAKFWLERRWAQVATTLQQDGMCVMLTAGPGEQALVDAIVTQMAHPPLVIHSITIGQLAALYACCRFVVGIDSGPLHIAVAVGVPTISLFGPSDPQRYGPWGDAQRQIVVRSGLWCSPCGVLHACPRGTSPSECMTLISVSQLQQAISEVLTTAV